MRVSEVMTRNPVCCVPSDPAQTAAMVMRDEDVGIVPVVSSKGSRKLAGVVTDRDLCIGVIANRPQIESSLLPVERFLTSEVICCKADDDLDTVLDLMLENQVRRIVVLDEQENISGIVSMADVVNRGQTQKGDIRKVMKGISEPAQEASKPGAKSTRSGR